MSRPTTSATTSTAVAALSDTPNQQEDQLRLSKAESSETAIAKDDAAAYNKQEPGAKWKNKETHEIPYK
jgi:hypothetical protein